MQLNRTGAPSVDPVTLDEAKAHLNVTGSADDTKLTSYIAAATLWAEKLLSRVFCEQTWVLKLDAFPTECDRAIALPKPPLVSVTTIQYVDTAGATQTLASTEYQVSSDEYGARIVEAYGKTWPSTRGQPDAVIVTYIAGYPKTGAGPSYDYRANVPEPIKAGIKMKVQGLYDNLRAEDMTALDSAIYNMLFPYKLVVV